VVNGILFAIKNPPSYGLRVTGLEAIPSHPLGLPGAPWFMRSHRREDPGPWSLALALALGRGSWRCPIPAGKTGMPCVPGFQTTGAC